MFAVEGKDVIPVQQCVRHARETAHGLCGHGWYRKGDCLLEWEFTPVQEQLDAYYWKLKSKEQEAVEFPTAGPLRKLLLITMKPAEAFLMFKWPEPGANRHDYVHEKVQTHMGTGSFPSHMAIFGYDGYLEKWVLTHNGTTLSITDTVRKLTGMMYGAICFGNSSREPRIVVCLFAKKWMVYDRYDTVASITQKFGRTASAAQIPSCDNCGADTFELPCPGVCKMRFCGLCQEQGWQYGRNCACEYYTPRVGTEVSQLVGDYPPLEAETLLWYDKNAEKREGLADEVRAEAEETEFQVGQSLRLTWLQAQRIDKSLAPLFTSKEMAKGYRRAEDGLLERSVPAPLHLGERWVPVVPEGQATAHLSWKRLMFLQCHCGILGGHRNAEKTLAILLRQAWWAWIGDNVRLWTSKCITCLRFRKMQTKQEQVPTIATTAECWEEVMIDLEGPSTPCDKNGNMYTMTYICTVCHGVLLEASPKANSAECRRMFACCIMRSGTIPTMVRSDRGPELKNALMNEYCALVGIGRRFGTPWRPMEQGLVEGKHVETQKSWGFYSRMSCSACPMKRENSSMSWSSSSTTPLVPTATRRGTSTGDGLWPRPWRESFSRLP